ncbi:MAG TPA: CPBP family intramembrane glutamic endopeptidase, partial [Sphingomonadales bacterium]|nr:CPBP family intramembrane glutamic endopeptidase [Sphingomonadales bacterium]
IGVTVLFLNARGVELYELGLRRPVPWKSVLGFGAAIAAGVYAVSIAVQFLLSQAGIEPNLEDFSLIQGNFALYLYAVTLFTWVSAAFGEEVLFRGFVMRNLQAMFGEGERGWHLANVAQAAIFALFHFNQGVGGVIPIFLVALAFGYAFIRLGKSLWPLIVAHGIVDMVSFTLVYLGLTEF